MVNNDPEFPPPQSAGVMRKRALRLRCPVCGEGRPFIGWFGMHDECPVCEYHFDRESGYFLGSIYVNYGLCGAIALIWAVLATYVWELGFWLRIVTPAIIMVILSFWFHRYSRALWMAFDLSWDPQTEKDFGPKPTA